MFAISLYFQAVANQTSATFLRVVGSELIQKLVLLFIINTLFHYCYVLKDNAAQKIKHQALTVNIL